MKSVRKLAEEKYRKIFDAEDGDIFAESNIFIGPGTSHESVLIITFLMELEESLPQQCGFDLISLFMGDEASPKSFEGFVKSLEILLEQ